MKCHYFGSHSMRFFHRISTSKALIASCVALSLVSCSSAGRAGRANEISTLQGARDRFDEIDQNGDGVVTPDELGNRRLFRRVDTNGDREITPSEARAALENRRASQEDPAAETTAGDTTDVTNNTTAALSRGESTTALDIPYATPAGFDPSLTSLDIYTPENAGSAPVMVYVHGGAWMNGDKGNVGSKPAFFNRNGYVFVSLNYRLVPDVEFPVNAQDVADGIAWVHSNIQQYGGNPDRLFVMGHSAGAHLAALASTDEQYLAAAGKSLDILNGTVLLDGAVYDIPLVMQSPGRRGEELYTGVFSDNPGIWKQASPVTHVRSGANIPPFFLVHANNKYNKETQALRLQEVLRAANVRVEVLAAPNETHQSLNQTLGEEGNVATDAVVEFTDSQ